MPRIPSKPGWKGVEAKGTAKRRGNAAERRWYAGGEGGGRGGMEGEGRLVGGAPINMAAGEGVAEGSFEGVVDGERGTSTAILSHLCDLELFPPPQEKAARALLSSSSPPSCSAGDRMHGVMHLLRNISLHESWTSWRNRGDLSIASLFDFSRTQRESTCLFGDGKLIELGCLAD